MEVLKDKLATNKKNSESSITKVKEILQQISKTYFEDDKVLQKVEENNNKISEYSTEVSALRKEYDNEKKILENKIHEFKEHSDLLKTLKAEKEQLDVSVKELELSYKGLKKTKPSVNDIRLLETGKRKLKLYKEFTSIRWDYSALDAIEGYLTNKQEFLQKIQYKGDIDYKKLRELLWEDIYKSTQSTTIREDVKENLPVNK